MSFTGNRILLVGLVAVVVSACNSSSGGGSNNGGGEPPPVINKEFVTFETGQVRPLALSPDRNTLYVTKNRCTC